LIYPEPRLLPCGDLAVSVELADEINREVNARVLALEYLIQQKGIAGVTETLPTYRSLLVYYDPAVIGADELHATLRALVAEARPEVLPPARIVEVPCAYGGELGFELETAAGKLGLAPEEMVGDNLGRTSMPGCTCRGPVTGVGHLCWRPQRRGGG